MIDAGSLFRQVPNPSPMEKLHIDRPVFAVGSCFVENMTEKLQNYRVPLCVNPSGVLYNPSSIADLLSRIVSNRFLESDEVFEADGLFRSYYTHTLLNQNSAEDYIETVNSRLSEACSVLETAEMVLITLGTALVWRLKESGAVVANCQKQPGNLFDRDLLTEEEVTTALQSICASIRDVNKSALILFTVSPVRYEKKKPFLNSVSKGRLFSALGQIVDEKDVCYFPAYEILMDELRDYRFYADDFVHPSPLAVSMIWERFITSYGTKEFLRYIPLYDEVLKMKQHIMGKGKEAMTESFLRSIEKKIESVEAAFSLKLAAERTFFGLL